MLVCRDAAFAEGESVWIHRIPLEEKRERREARERCADSPEAEYHRCFLSGPLNSVWCFSWPEDQVTCLRCQSYGQEFTPNRIIAQPMHLNPIASLARLKLGRLDGFRLTQLKRKGEKKGIIHCPFPSLT